MRKPFSRRRIRWLLGLTLAGAGILQSQRALSQRAQEASPAPAPRPQHPKPTEAYASPSRDLLLPPVSLEEEAARDPYAFLEASLENYDRSVRDYTCIFSKRERLAGELGAEQVMRAMFRQEPFSVRLEWIKNPDKCSRVLYVADRWVEDGRQMALVEPYGAIARFFVSYVMRPIHGPEAAKYSRKTIDQFGLRSSLALTLKYAALARQQNQLELTYLGTGEVDGRKTLAFERRLPYTGEDSPWPDRVLIVHLDREYRVPTLCESYADDAKEHLLARYMVTQVRLNPNLPDSVFTPQGMGLE